MNARPKFVALILAASLSGVICRAEDPPPPPVPYQPLSAGTGTAQPAPSPMTPGKPSPTPVPDVPFSQILRKLVVQKLPHDVVFEQNENWGHQAHVPSLQGLKVIHVMRNHGTWQKMRAISNDVPNRAQLLVQELRYSADRVSYTVQLYLPATFEFEHQIWQNGIPVQGSRGRARFRFNAAVSLEAKIQFNGAGELVPEQVAPPRITDSRVLCDFFVVENVDGLGGEIAHVIAGKIDHPFHQWKPVVERDMRAKVNQAVMQAEQSPLALAATAKLVNAIVREATARALHPPFSAAVVADAPPPGFVGPLPPPAGVVQIDPSILTGFGAFLDIRLNGQVSPGRAATSDSERSGHSGFSSGGSFSSGHSSGSESSSSSHHESSSSHGDSPHRR